MTNKRVGNQNTGLFAKVLEPARLINYQPGAVVSSELIRKKAGTITLFAFDSGQGLSTHQAPFDAVLQVVEGSCEVKVDGKPFRLKKGNVIILPAKKSHSVMAIQRFKMMLVMIKA